MNTTQASAIWDIILTAAERDERVREALRASLPVPSGAADRGWPRIEQSIRGQQAEPNGASLHDIHAPITCSIGRSPRADDADALSLSAVRIAIPGGRGRER